MKRNALAIKLIEKYQQSKSIIGTGHCRFYPTCSNYAKEAYQKFNFFYATLLTTVRLIRCNPFAERRYYPVPLTKKEKQDKLYLQSINKYINSDFTEYLLSLDARDDIDNLYPYIYDYYYLPNKSHISDTNTTIYTSRFILSNNKLNKQINNTKLNITFEDLMKIVHELKNEGYINKNIEKNILQDYDNYIYEIDQLSIADILELLNIKEGTILINNCNDNINYLDFKELTLDEKELKHIYDYINKYPKLIIKTNLKDVVKYLSIVDISINIYNNINEINFLYQINKRR